MGCVILSYGGYQTSCKVVCSHFKGPLGSVGITVQPQVWNMNGKTALTSDRKTSDHLMHGTLLLTETSVIS